MAPPWSKPPSSPTSINSAASLLLSLFLLSKRVLRFSQILLCDFPFHLEELSSTPCSHKATQDPPRLPKGSLSLLCFTPAHSNHASVPKKSSGHLPGAPLSLGRCTQSLSQAGLVSAQAKTSPLPLCILSPHPCFIYLQVPTYNYLTNTIFEKKKLL